ncbi:MAG: hypothetical protein RLZZ241_2129 [Bacteroidota bacterium]|jgi:dihydrofolate synthase/folylpolyglutamate synthase
MDYQQTVAWMFAQLPMYQIRGAAAYSAKLEPTLRFVGHLGNPEQNFKSIHIAGTNGKGSSSHMLASILQEAGYRVGLYTSPHLRDFRERIRINGIPIPEHYVVDFIAQQKSYLSEAGLSFFEMTVGLALSYFSDEKVDIAVIEVGMGGRLDSTNIITPEVSLITNIGLDHTEFLGSSLPEIAAEKAGIIKPGIPVVISESHPETASVFNARAAACGSSINFADQAVYPPYKCSLLGDYQARNIKGVLAVLKALRGYRILDKHVEAGLSRVVENTGLLGRWQQLLAEPQVICDTAHNREGLDLVLRQWQKIPCAKRHLVLGFVKEKQLDLLLPLFPKEAKYYLSRPNIQRGMPLELLEQGFRNYGFDFTSYASVPEAYHAALSAAAPQDLVFVGGSTFTVAEVV